MRLQFKVSMALEIAEDKILITSICFPCICRQSILAKLTFLIISYYSEYHSSSNRGARKNWHVPPSFKWNTQLKGASWPIWKRTQLAKWHNLDIFVKSFRENDAARSVFSGAVSRRFEPISWAYKTMSAVDIRAAPLAVNRIQSLLTVSLISSHSEAFSWETTWYQI